MLQCGAGNRGGGAHVNPSARARARLQDRQIVGEDRGPVGVKRTQEAADPALRIAFPHARGQRLMALYAFLSRHGDRALNRVSYAIRVIGVDDERFAQVFGGSSKTREHQELPGHPRSAQ